MLLVVWVTAVFAPAVITLLSREKEPVMVMNLNEEEQKSGEKQFKKYLLPTESLWSSDTVMTKPGIAFLEALNHSGPYWDVISPPPEHS